MYGEIRRNHRAKLLVMLCYRNLVKTSILRVLILLKSKAKSRKLYITFKK